MAKVTPGPLAGYISGAVGNVVFSRGRYGPYIRSRTIPTLVQNDYTRDVRDRLILLSGEWAGLDGNERDAWCTWASTHPITDRVGDVRVLQGSAAFIGLNARILQALGTQIDLPPVSEAPHGVTGSSVVAEATGGTVVVSWTSGALGATECLACRVAIYDSVGKKYYKNLLKLVTISAAAEVSPLDVGPDVLLRFGPIVAGQVVKCNLEVWDNTTGLVSPTDVCETLVVA